MGGRINARQCSRAPQATWVRPTPWPRLGGLWAPCRSVDTLLSLQEREYSEKNPLKISAQSELQISGNIRNGFRPETGTRNRREQRERSNLGGDPPLREPWRPWTRGETLLPSRGRPSKKKKEGGSLPSLPVVPERRRGNHCDGDLHQQLRRRHHQLSPPLCSGVTPLLPAVIST